MSKKAIKIDKSDKYRVLLTEVLPYEVPIIFSNDGFYKYVKADNAKSWKCIYNKLVSGYKTEWGIPYQYWIRKYGSNERRELGIIHPNVQLCFVDLYEKYDLILVNLSTKSEFSLRHICRPASCFYRKKLQSESENDIELLSDDNPMYMRSYFVYEPYDLINKFYESWEFRRLEQRFYRLLRFDIKKCFYNIYTHSFSWAVKGKEYAKKNTKKSVFENNFDKLMQSANYNETNGIIVGPEVSRIFAEIIFQQVDLDAVSLITDFANYKLGIDYAVRRYVDDFFIFTNDEKIERIILRSYSDVLNKYKLYINESKTQCVKRPFISDISIGRIELGEYLKTHVKASVNFEKPYHVASEFIKNFQSIVKKYSLNYGDLVKDVLMHIKRSVDVLLYAKNIGEESCGKYILSLLCIAFYVYTLDINFNTTYKLASILNTIDKYRHYLKKEDELEIKKQISNEIKKCVDIYLGTSREDDSNIEILNLLIIAKKFSSSDMLHPNKLMDLFHLHSEAIDKFGYFQICTILFYIENLEEYKTVKKKIIAIIKNKFKGADNHFIKAELLMLFLDIMACPYLEKVVKLELIVECFNKKNNSEAGEFLKTISNNWFINWDQDFSMDEILLKKEWSKVY